MSLNDAVRDHAYQLGADLVGFGGMDRCRHAPPMMSPQGLYPEAASVVVMAIHHPDACIELGGETHPQQIGPYSVQYLMNQRLDEMSYRMATFLERQGHGAVPIVSSNIWRYNQYKALKAIFAPDVSHIYMAVVAGLAEVGFSGLALTPEYGARNRFVTVITDAPLDADPLIPPGSVCDGCMLCREHCPAHALSKEIDGEKVLRIGPYEYRFPNKNLWRCAWGEHFDLDLDLEIPEQVTEKVILEKVAAHGVRCGEMGQCLKFCVPKPLRTFDRDYSRTPMRRYAPAPTSASTDWSAIDRLLAAPLCQGADEAIVSTAEALRQDGIDLDAILPGARSAVTLLVRPPVAGDNALFRVGARYQVNALCYDLTRKLEQLGCRSVMTIQPGDPTAVATSGANPSATILQLREDLRGQAVIANTVVTRQALAPQRRGARTGARWPDCGDATADIATDLTVLARELGADLVGVAPASRIDEMAAHLRPIFESETVLDARDEAIRFTPWQPVVTASSPRVRTAADWLPTAKSVVVIGLRYHRAVLRHVGQPPAEAVGPYSFQTFVTEWLGTIIGYRLIKRLEELGYTGVMTTDLTGTDSFAATPRGPVPDLFANRFAGVAAGLGYLTISGHLATPQFGLRQRVVAIVSDAPLTASPLRQAPAEGNPCESCHQPCIAACPSQAISSQRVNLTCEGHAYTFNLIDRRRCDWVKRYALMGDGGFKFLGSSVDIPPPEKITPAALDAALRQHDPIKKYRPITAEPCVIQCPLALDDFSG